MDEKLKKLEHESIFPKFKKVSRREKKNTAVRSVQSLVAAKSPNFDNFKNKFLLGSGDNFQPLVKVKKATSNGRLDIGTSDTESISGKYANSDDFTAETGDSSQFSNPIDPSQSCSNNSNGSATEIGDPDQHSNHMDHSESRTLDSTDDAPSFPSTSKYLQNKDTNNLVKLKCIENRNIKSSVKLPSVSIGQDKQLSLLPVQTRNELTVEPLEVSGTDAKANHNTNSNGGSCSALGALAQYSYSSSDTD